MDDTTRDRPARGREGSVTRFASMKSKLDTLAWFAARPAMYREAVRRVVGGRFTTRASVAEASRQKESGRAWCESAVIDPERLCSELGLPAPIRSVREVEPRWHEAVVRAESIPDMGGPGHVDLLYHLCLHLPARSVVETGVAAGWSSLAILLAMDRLGSGRLVSIDMPYPKRGNEHLVGGAVPTELRARWKLVRRPDRDALEPTLERLGPIDLAHYDSDKSPEGRAYAYPLLFAALRPGGILVSDDVEDNLVFRDFCASHGRRPWVFRKHEDGANYAGLVVK